MIAKALILRQHSNPRRGINLDWISLRTILLARLTMSEDVIYPPASKPRPFLSPIPRLRIGSTLRTRRGVIFRVREAVVLVAQNGGESPSLTVERIRDGLSVEFFMTVGKLANLTRGAIHNPGTGIRIDWATTPRRELIGGPRSQGIQWPPAVRREPPFTRG